MSIPDSDSRLFRTAILVLSLLEKGAASRKDFIHKNRIVLRELRETIIVLHIVQGTHINNNETLDSMIKENDELIAIFVKSIITAENNSKKV